MTLQCFTDHESSELTKSIEALLDQNKSLLLKASAMMGYLKLVNILTAKLTINFLGKELENGLWNDSPLLIAVENQSDRVVNAFVRKFQYDVTWLDVRQMSLFSFLLQEKKYACIQYLLNPEISDLKISELGKSYGDGQLPLYEALRAKETPQALIEMLLQVTDVDFFNKNAFPSVEWYSLGYDLSLTDKMLDKGFTMQQSKIGIKKRLESQTWEIYCDDCNRPSTKQEKRAALDIFSQQFEVWIDRMALGKFGVGFHQESLEQIKKIYYVLNIVVIEQESNTILEQMLLKAIIINPTCNFVQLHVKSHSINLWINSEKIDLSNKTEESVKANIFSAHENGLLQENNKTQILELLELNEIPDFEENTHNSVSEIIKYKAIGMLSAALLTLENAPIQKEELQNMLDKLSKLVQLMEKYTQDWVKLKDAVENNSDCNTADLNLSETIINCVDNQYGSLLHYAIFKNNLNFAKKLLENGAHPNLKVKSFNPERLIFTDDSNRVFEQDMTTPMHVAAARGNLNIIELLKEHGASINFRTSNTRYTPLHVAACEGHSEVVRYLKENGAIDSFENEKTPLELAQKYDHRDVIKILTP